jgi:hypothetical protein
MQLYPKAAIQQKGFENTEFPDTFFDIAVGNVPFGDYGVIDKRYDKQNFAMNCCRAACERLRMSAERGEAGTG